MFASLLKKLPPGKLIWAAAFCLVIIPGLYVLYRYYPVARKFFPRCPSYEFFGVYCSGCGNTRALYYLLHGDFVNSIRNNLFFIPTLIFIAVLCKKPAKVSWNLLLYSFLAVALLFSILRNLPWYPFTLLAPAPFPS